MYSPRELNMTVGEILGDGKGFLAGKAASSPCADHAHFDMQQVNEEKIGYAFLLNSNLHTNAACYGLRPVVSFNINRLNISDTTKTGTETAPWEIK